MTDTHVSGRWTLTITNSVTGFPVTIRFASETAARAYAEELKAQNEQLDDEFDSTEEKSQTYMVWFDTTANPASNFPRPSRGLRSAIGSAEAYDPNDY